MKRTMSTVFSIVVTLLSSSAFSQTFTDRTWNAAGIYVTRPVYAELTRLIENDVVRRASANLSAVERERLRAEIRSANVLTAVDPGWKVATTTTTSQEASVITGSISEALSYAQVGFYIRTYPRVQLDIQPVPPRDYKVLINGEQCPATMESQYAIRSGKVSVVVTRDPKPPCRWEGMLTSGAVQVVTCRF